MDVPRWEEEPITYLTIRQVERLFDGIMDPRDLLLFDLTYRHGLRGTEAARLRLDYFHDGRIWIVRLKHGQSRAYRLHPRSVELLERYLKVRPDDGSPYLLRTRRHTQNPMSRAEINRLFHRYARTAGLPSRLSHVHVLRHSIAVHLAQIGWDPAAVQQWLGHRDISSTMVYFRITEKRWDAQQRAMHRSRGIARTGR